MSTAKVPRRLSVVPLRLVRDEINHDTVRTLKLLLDAAKAGDVIGLAYVAVLKSSNTCPLAAVDCMGRRLLPGDRVEFIDGNRPASAKCWPTGGLSTVGRGRIRASRW